MQTSFLFPSLCRIADFEQSQFDIEKIPRNSWGSGDYVAAKITKPSTGNLQLELTSGRMISPMRGDWIIGALGRRHATLEATGSWEAVHKDGNMDLLTGAGLLGKLTSKSHFINGVIEARYMGHIVRNQRPVRMQDFAPTVPLQPLTKPVVLMVGTSMSAGKTTAARIVTRIFQEQGLRVVGAKLTGAGRYRDILTVQDAGAEDIFDFVDVGLPSSIAPKEVFLPALRTLLSLIEASPTDIAVIEVGASPLEPYNGDLAIAEIKDRVVCSILCASDPYAVYGVMKSFDMIPTLASGVATNTIAGIELIEKLCGVPALNIIEENSQPRLKQILMESLSHYTLDLSPPA